MASSNVSVRSSDFVASLDNMIADGNHFVQEGADLLDSVMGDETEHNKRSHKDIN